MAVVVSNIGRMVRMVVAEKIFGPGVMEGESCIFPNSCCEIGLRCGRYRSRNVAIVALVYPLSTVLEVCSVFALYLGYIMYLNILASFLSVPYLEWVGWAIVRW